jgi:hypothetical protein
MDLRSDSLQARDSEGPFLEADARQGNAIGCTGGGVKAQIVTFAK